MISHFLQSIFAQKVLFLPSFLFSILIYWVILILTLKCLGEERTGFLSGSNLIDQPQHLDSGLRYEKKPRFLRSSLVRIIFILSGCAILVFCMLLATEGIKNVESTISTIEKTVLVSTLCLKYPICIFHRYTFTHLLFTANTRYHR